MPYLDLGTTTSLAGACGRQSLDTLVYVRIQAVARQVCPGVATDVIASLLCSGHEYSANKVVEGCGKKQTSLSRQKRLVFLEVGVGSREGRVRSFSSDG